MQSIESYEPRAGINDNDYPLNLYGDDEVYKSFPDIGEPIKNGILFSCRRKFNNQVLYDFKSERLRHAASDDKSFFVEGVVVDLDIYCNNPEYFDIPPQPINSIEEFRDYYSVPLRDFNAAGVVCGHLGRLLSSMKQGYYNVYNARVKVNAEKISECLKAIDEIINRL